MTPSDNNVECDGFRLALIALESTFLHLDGRSRIGTRLRDRLLYWHDKKQVNNTCTIRFPAGDPYAFSYRDATDNISKIVPCLKDLGTVYELLSDQASRDLFLDLLSYRILGSRHVRLSINTDYGAMLQQADQCVRSRNVIPAGFSLGNNESCSLDYCSFDYGTDRINLYATAGGILTEFILAQYAYQGKDVSIAAGLGDTVIDGGACWGDSSLYFASRVGNAGKVYAFELLPTNQAILEKNLMLNLDLGTRVTVVPHPLWNSSGEDLPCFQNGPGSRIVTTNNGFPVQGTSGQTVTIDDFVTSSRISKVDFIKMDIEGAELNALRGAVRTLSRFRPKLAICIYHNAQADYTTVPLFLQSLGIYNSFYIKHSSIHLGETVLFATVTQEATG